MLRFRQLLWTEPSRRFSSRTVTMNKVDPSVRDIPRPRSLPIFGTKLSLSAAGGGSRLHEYVHNRHSQLGPIFCENMNGADIVFTSDPEFMRTLFIKLEGKHPAHILPEPWVLYNKMYGVKRGLFFMDGEEWLHYRKILNRLVLREDSESWLAEPIRRVTSALINRWIADSESGSFVPQLEPAFYRLSIDVIISILTGSCVAPRTKHYDHLLGLFAESVQKIFQTTTKLYVLPASFYANNNLKAWRNFKESVDTSLVMAQKLVKEIITLHSAGNGLINKLIKNGVSEEDIIRIVADFVIAAGDTTSYTLLWTLYLLATNRDVAIELKEKDTKFVNCVIKESMRLYPVAPFLTRIIPKECLMGPFVLNEGVVGLISPRLVSHKLFGHVERMDDKRMTKLIYKPEASGSVMPGLPRRIYEIDVILREGQTPIVASIYTSGRSESYFSMPDNFLPHRWDRDDARRSNLPVHVPSASLPFALGSRSCIGKKIAQLQMTQVFEEVSRHFDLTLLNRKKVRAITSQVLVPNDPIKIQFTLK